MVGVLVMAAGLILKTNLFLAAFDLRLLQDVSHLHSGVGNAVALALHAGLRGLSAVVVLALVVGAMMALTRSVRNGLTIFVLTTGGWAATAVMKILVSRSRPDQSLLADSLLPGVQGATSFPSGHTAFAASLGIAVALVMWRTRWRTPAIVSAAVFAGLVGASRIYLGVHYVSDVVASFVLSAAVIVLLTGATGFFQRYRASLIRIGSPEGGRNP
ncbi:phosphatase PAP2 family protein [Arthrobacter echini]|uniref:Phosphatase PAP2 family protein n=2 Tax=Arthrobacter echini TaxID=1529066 RepID=A0A5D0XIN9_9MICC|nr:phosphatase PAP2 family protein [Arthrobacter echini]TYC96454.1 phosphatase PAP2 family protein [Arthrobacter echini]